ncbi:WD40 repeat domain-containing protein [Virgisporangium aurantiacum]|uniref:WD40-like Beta Propeller Repeat n=1 Tax=Virgisporangium aurantiacum TaxID=175570 RepID=A0A8J3Z442_9ACTN|nr:hypothetical protein [Virgisporangium aurantiacum]GIJ54906.1 hypothetical protein Vau01_024220 [Virgisporangium aurantiacum]
MTRLHDALDDVAAHAPEVRIPPRLYRAARRRHRLAVGGAVLSVVAVVAAVALVVPFARHSGRTSSVAGGNGSAGLPDRISMPPWSTSDRPAGPAAVAFDGTVPQADNEDFDWPWWRSGHTVNPSVVVGLHTDTYRVVRGAYSVGTELSPDGRYLLVPDRRVLDLTTGRTRQALPPKPGWPVGGAWSADGTRILYVEDRVTTVLSWPSLRVEARFPHPDQVPVDQDVALSPDGSLLAVHSNEVLTVYRADGTKVWTSPEDLTSNITYSDVGRLRIGGRAAWHPDGRLVLFGRNDLTCDDCGVHPGTWKIEMVDGLFGSTPGLVVASSYPVFKSALDVRIVAWRGEDAYAVVTWARGGTGEAGRVGLVRMRPGEGAFEWVLKAPDGVTSMQVATEFVDVQRPTGDPSNGFNVRELLGQLSTGVLCLAPFVLAVGFVIRLSRRSRRRLGR